MPTTIVYTTGRRVGPLPRRRAVSLIPAEAPVLHLAALALSGDNDAIPIFSRGNDDATCQASHGSCL
jgi:hypothetical protein